MAAPSRHDDDRRDRRHRAVFTDEDRERLGELERTMAGGLDAYVAVGRALEEIRTRRLYRLSHRTFREYLADRWNLSEPRLLALLLAQVATTLEAAGEYPAGSESALREFAPVLHRDGPEATVAASREVTNGDGVLPSATRTRQRLVTAGLVNRPQRNVVDGMQRRIVWLESALPKVKPHETIRPLIAGYAVRVWAIADQHDAIADDGPAVPAGELCVGHGARRGPDGNCLRCRRPDVCHGSAEAVGCSRVDQAMLSLLGRFDPHSDVRLVQAAPGSDARAIRPHELAATD